METLGNTNNSILSNFIDYIKKIKRFDYSLFNQN